jgi:uncharacterized protein with beta-barrel porin domain
MQITGGDYTFSGGEIRGLAPATAGQTVTGKLEILGGSATFNNTLDFVNGVEVGTGAAVKFGTGGSVATDLSMFAGSTLNVDVDRSSAQVPLVVGGVVTLVAGAQLDINVVNASGTFDEFLIISATGGFFDTTEFTLIGTWQDRFASDIRGNDYYVLWSAVTPSFADIIDPYGTTNAKNVAAAVDQIGASGGIDALYKALADMPNTDPQGLANAFAQLHGEVFAGGKMMGLQMQKSFLWHLPGVQDRYMETNDGVYRGQSPCARAYNTRAGDFVAESWNRWGAFAGDWLERKSVGTASGYDLRSAGVVVGMDRKFSRNAFGGIAFGYDNAYQNFTSIQSNNQIDMFRTALYGGVRNGRTYTDGYVGYTKNWNKTRRDIPLLAATARSKYEDDIFSTGFEVGRRLSSGDVRLTPSIGLHYVHLSSPDITETGAGVANLHVAAQSYDSLRMPIGARLSRPIESRGLCPRIFSFDSATKSPALVIWTPEVRAFYIREFADASVRTSTAFDAVRGVPFFAESGNWGRNSGRFGAGLNAGLADWLNVRVDYDYEVYDHTATNAFSATLGVKF